MIRVVAGTARGLLIEAPASDARPTLNRAREALFSILHSRIEGARFADFFAGSGANGIEALSRGAEYCAFVDSDTRAIHTIGRNLFHTKLGHKARSYQLTLPQSLGVIATKEARFDIVFCDPPFEGVDYEALLSQIAEKKLVTTGGVLVVEHEDPTELPQAVGGLTRGRVAQYGRVAFSFYT